MATAGRTALDALKRFRARELAALHKPSMPLPLPAQTSPGAAALRNPFVPHKNPASGRWAPPKYSLRQQAALVKHAKAAGALALLPPGPKHDPGAPKRPKDDPAYMAKLRARRLRTAVQSSAADPFAFLDAPADGAGVARAAASGAVLQTDAVADVVAGAAKSGATNFRARRRAAKAAAAAAATAQKQKKAKKAKARAWDSAVEWVGTPRRRYIPGADIGVRLYAGKALMFKGRRWERDMPARQARIKMLLRDMPQRIDRFRRWHAKSKPQPLKPAKGKAKAQKLPF